MSTIEKCGIPQLIQSANSTGSRRLFDQAQAWTIVRRCVGEGKSAALIRSSFIDAAALAFQKHAGMIRAILQTQASAMIGQPGIAGYKGILFKTQKCSQTVDIRPGYMYVPLPRTAPTTMSTSELEKLTVDSVGLHEPSTEQWALRPKVQI